MKLRLLPLFAILVIALFFQSCSSGKYYAFSHRPVAKTLEIVGPSSVIETEKTDKKTTAIPETDLAASQSVAEAPVTAKEVFSRVYNQTRSKTQTIVSATEVATPKADVNVTKAKDLKKKIKSVFSSDGRRTHWAAIAGFLCSVVSYAILGLILSICGIVFSIIALSSIYNNPDMYKGKGWAILGLILGIIALAIMIAFLSSM